MCPPPISLAFPHYSRKVSLGSGRPEVRMLLKGYTAQPETGQMRLVRDLLVSTLLVGGAVKAA
jgi:hypothetical protein